MSHWSIPRIINNFSYLSTDDFKKIGFVPSKDNPTPVPEQQLNHFLNILNNPNLKDDMSAELENLTSRKRISRREKAYLWELQISIFLVKKIHLFGIDHDGRSLGDPILLVGKEADRGGGIGKPSTSDVLERTLCGMFDCLLTD